jgi:hypothetical protein
MNPRALLEELEREPFNGLRLHLTDGRKVIIQNPDVAMIADLAVYVFKVRKEGGRIADDTHVVSLRHIVSIERLEPRRRRAG